MSAAEKKRGEVADSFPPPPNLQSVVYHSLLPQQWLISSVGIFFCALVSLSVSGYSISENQVVEELHTTKTLALLGITTFTVRPPYVL